MHLCVWTVRRVDFPPPLPPEPPIPLRTSFLVKITQFEYHFGTDSERYVESSYYFANERVVCTEDVYFKLCGKPRRVPRGPE
eukprot:1193476-Pleurochrysis_carterae.AAC.1